MKKIILYAFLLIIVLLSFSCLTVRRWPFMSEEKRNKTLQMSVGNNIFNDFLWTTPPLYSKKLEFSNKGDKKTVNLYFAKKELTFVLDKDNIMTLQLSDDNNIISKPKRSHENAYYNMDLLKTKIVSRQKLVEKIRYITKTVFTTKMVRIRVIDKDGDIYYITEPRTVLEYITVPETYMDWDTVYEEVIDIPDYIYYEFKLPDNPRIIIYKILELDGTVNYYLQNTTYYYALDHEYFMWDDVDIRILIIDANSNGIYFEDEDRVLFNSWNPYEEYSKYRDIPEFMDNYWYRLGELKQDKFLTLTANENNNRLMIANANNEFIDTHEKGKINIINIPDEADVIINEKIYEQNLDGELNRKIEYGVYKITIKQDWHVDFTDIFVINSTNPEYNLTYKETEKAGLLKFDNINSRNWTVEIKDENGNKKEYYNIKKIYLKKGKYKIKVSSGANIINEEIGINIGQTAYINCE